MLNTYRSHYVIIYIWTLKVSTSACLRKVFFFSSTMLNPWIASVMILASEKSLFKSVENEKIFDRLAVTTSKPYGILTWKIILSSILFLYHCVSYLYSYIRMYDFVWGKWDKVLQTPQIQSLYLLSPRSGVENNYIVSPGPSSFYVAAPSIWSLCLRRSGGYPRGIGDDDVEVKGSINPSK